MAQTHPSPQQPIHLAREALRLLASRRIAPTPENYRLSYHEISGETDAPAAPPDESAGALRELLAQTLEAVAAQWREQPALALEAKSLAQTARAASGANALQKLATALKQFWHEAATTESEAAELQQGLLRLLRLMVENISELVSDETWLVGQLAILREIIAQPLNARAIADAERGLKEAIFKQSALKHSLSDAKTSFKQMVAGFIEHLGALSQNTGDYHDKIEGYSKQLGQAQDAAALDNILQAVLLDTRGIQASVAHARDELHQARKQVVAAEQKIKQLEAELEQVSGKVREDHLTGALNRRGMSEAFERETALADRSGSPLSLALLDIDDFKKINDNYGHPAGDRVLVHLIQVARESARPSDIISRFGGEEFLILLPGTTEDDAIEIITRLQRNLTRKIFLQNNERLLITFSAGVTLRLPGEHQDAAIERADKALYQAKQAGKNRVLKALQ